MHKYSFEKIANITQLKQELNDSAITSKNKSFFAKDSTLTIEFETELTEAEKALLTDIVNSHKVAVKNPKSINRIEFYTGVDSFNNKFLHKVRGREKTVIKKFKFNSTMELQEINIQFWGAPLGASISCCVKHSNNDKYKSLFNNLFIYRAGQYNLKFDSIPLDPSVFIELIINNSTGLENEDFQKEFFVTGVFKLKGEGI
jgi:hypothetical protein